MLLTNDSHFFTWSKKRKLQAEKERMIREQRMKEEHLNITEQKMTAAVHISIQKIKFLQAKLFDSKQERDAVALELESAKLTIQHLREKINKARVA
jgi:hypothetical protein